MFEKISSEVISAMKAKNSERLTTLRSLVSECKNAAIAAGNRAAPTVNECITTINRQVKQMEGAVEQFVAGGREDLVNKYKSQIDVIKEFLPKAPTDAEVEALMDEIIAELSATKKDMGLVIKTIKEKTQNMAPMTTVMELIKNKLK